MLFKTKNDLPRFLVVGLGNPGITYEKTRHNAGFMALDILAEDLKAEFLKHKFDSLYAETDFSGFRLILQKPQTFMNLSGKAVSEICSFYKIPIENIIIISDDISLDVGKIRLRRKGSAGGHNGLKDIFELMGSEEIKRIKIGVGERSNRESDLKNHVLGKIPEDQFEDFNSALNNAAGAVKDIIKNGIDHAMNRYSK